jgi:stage III sporulation protein AG
MAMKPFLEKISVYLKKYKFAVLILIIGLALMLFPKSTNEKEAEWNSVTPGSKVAFEDKLSSILSCVEGAGEVQVILTELSGEETLYQTDDDQSTNGDSVTNRTDTVTVTDSERNATGLVRQVVPPVYKGAIILCQGADNPSVRYDIINAVSKLIGIGANCISVLKMK